MNAISAFHLEGKKGLVLGLANEHSIAWGCARQAQAMGAEVVASCLNDKARPYVEPLTQSLGMDLQTCNIETPEELEKLVAYAVAKLGHFDFVIHSIAWAPLADLHGRVVDSSSTGFARAMEVSCHSFATLAKLCAPHMTQGGSMVTMTYLGAAEAVPHYGLMGPVKAALESLVRYMALELGPQGIRVYAVSPGPILTRAASGIEAFDALMQNNIAKAPLGRLVTLDEIANLSTFLCTNAASGMTGQTIYVDAGSHAVN
ncbi:enoyl-ACP reductase FabI [Limnohabitans sp.]|jgi:enoyl-[acyl-carrier protein] reductase I|uniref:enoyl-ACP reductase FabI n=1 Tax=Limnohabitans sp. TaxID=1907725 RepID=UPI00286F0C09|nr:enoyl-ACP reductase FabI [Limnohabitans sp.]